MRWNFRHSAASNQKQIFYLSFLVVIFAVISGDVYSLGFVTRAEAADRDASMIEVLKHEWHVDEEWDKIGKTKYIWKVTLFNHSGVRKRVYAYYYLLNDEGYPLARNVANRVVGPHKTAEIVANSYIMTYKVSSVINSRVTLKVGFPN